MGESVFIQSVREFGRGVGEFGRGVGKFRRRWGIWAEIGGLGQRWVWVWIGEFGRRQGFWMLRGWGGWVQIQELGRGLGNKEREFGRRAGESGR